ncbi:unnamed protein product [Owenia fusiformis]|uniref:Uncharacterized protein n=1 Tax=Owenia fusiformis TaxID=6347 RepID=A0A8J1UTM4_OWEFU|nr:unnamed protein product [Owenia fusiformis]
MSITIEAAAPKVPELRKAFTYKYSNNIKTGVYDPRDVNRIETDDAYCRCFLRTLTSKGDVEKALPVMDECLKFRKEWEINDLNENSFPAEIWERNAVYYKGHTKDGNKILYINLKENDKKDDEARKMIQKFIAYHFNLHHRETPEKMAVVLIDMEGASTGNMDMNSVKFIITCFKIYFPAYLDYMLQYDMPFILTAAWKVISALLNKEQAAKIRMIKKGEMKNYLDDDNLKHWPHMQ